MHLKKRALPLGSHTQSLSLHFLSLKTIKAHSSNWELQLKRLCHLRRLPEQRPKSWSNPFTRAPQTHKLHRTLPLLDHLFIFVFTYYICIDNSIFWCLIFWDWMYYWWYIIHRHHFLFKLGIFLFPLLTNSYVFFETCGFSYMTQTPCHSRGTTSSLFFNRFCHIEDNVQLGWGESWGSKYC